MTQTTHTAAGVFRVIFVIVFCFFLLTGFVLVFGQIAGLITTNPALVTWAAETLNAPAVVLASISGIFAFVYTYVDKSADADEEE